MLPQGVGFCVLIALTPALHSACTRQVSAYTVY